MVHAAKGKKVVHIDTRREEIGDDIIKKFLLGPTGNLRAPTIRRGKTLLVGYDEETFREVLKV